MILILKSAVKKVVPEKARRLARKCFSAFGNLFLGKKSKDKYWRFRKALEKNAKVEASDSNGFKFILYPWNINNIERQINRTFDMADFKAMEKLVNRNDTVFDVGAHIGRVSVHLSRLAGPEGRVHSFEPVPETFRQLEENIALNGCQNIVPSQRAVGKASGEVVINTFPMEYSSWNTMGRPKMPGPEGAKISPGDSVKVACVTLDDYCRTNRIKRINFLKVDVEGFETEVFEGGEGILEEGLADYISFEVSQEPLKGSGYAAKDIFDVLAHYGYSVFEFDGKSGTFRGPFADSDKFFTNYYASRKDLRLVSASINS